MGIRTVNLNTPAPAWSVRSISISDATLKSMALNATPLQILPAVPGSFWLLGFVCWFCSFSAGAYGNVNASFITGLTTGFAPTNFNTGGISSPTMTGWNANLIAAANNLITDNIAGFDFAGNTAFAQNLLVNQTINWLIDNKANALTGGNAANKITLLFESRLIASLF